MLNYVDSMKRGRPHHAQRKNSSNLLSSQIRLKSSQREHFSYLNLVFLFSFFPTPLSVLWSTPDKQLFALTSGRVILMFFLKIVWVSDDQGVQMS